jgi:hypothetical protein
MGGLRKSLVADNGMKTAAGLRKSHPATSDASHFWSSYTSNPHDLGCKHVRHFMYEVERTQLGGCDSLLTRIDEAYDAVLAGCHPAAHAPTGTTPVSAPSQPIVQPIVQPVVQPAVAAVLESDVRQWSALTREILDVAGPQVQEKQPVRILGPAGYGKTYGARRLGRSGLWNEFYEHAIYPDHEASDLLGGPRPMAIARADGTFDRQWIHQDSEPIKAFRAAAAGRTVFLLIDEMGNARRDVLNVLKNMINPEDGMYRLQTGRAVGIENGIARGEVLEAPVKNLTIVGTSNIGGEYEANTGDPAVVNRFYSIFLPIDHAEVLRMVHKHAVAKGLGRDCALQIERFYANMQKLLANSTIERLPNPRDFAKVIAVSKDEAQVPAMLARFGPQWVGQDLDGAPNAAQLAYGGHRGEECLQHHRFHLVLAAMSTATTALTSGRDLDHALAHGRSALTTPSSASTTSSPRGRRSGSSRQGSAWDGPRGASTACTPRRRPGPMSSRGPLGVRSAAATT